MADRSWRTMRKGWPPALWWALVHAVEDVYESDLLVNLAFDTPPHFIGAGALFESVCTDRDAVSSLFCLGGIDALRELVRSTAAAHGAPT